MNQNDESSRIANMDERISQLYAALPAINPPAGFTNQLFAALDARKEFLRFRRNLSLALSGLAIQLGMFFFFWKALVEEIQHAPFLSYALVLTQDIDVLAANWQDALLAMLDMIPVISIMSGLAFLGCGLLITRIIARHLASQRNHNAFSH